MKRIAALTLVLLLLALPVCAETIVVDLETATAEQLAEWIDALTARRLALTGVTEKALSPGVYTVGRDLAAGEYRLMVDDTVDSAFIYVYASGAEAWYDYEHFYPLGNYHGVTEIGKLTLADGDRLDIQGASIQLLSYTG